MSEHVEQAITLKQAINQAKEIRLFAFQVGESFDLTVHMATESGMVKCPLDRCSRAELEGVMFGLRELGSVRGIKVDMICGSSTFAPKGERKA